MIYRIKLRNKRTNTSIWFGVKANDQKEAIRKVIATLIYSNIYNLYEIRKVKKAI